MSPKTAKKNSTSSSGISKSSEVRIRLKSFDSRQIDATAKQLAEIISQTGVEISGPIPLPSKKRRYCVNSSTHVDKRSGEHFQVRVHNRLIVISNPLDETMVALQKIDLPAGVGVKVQVLEAKN
jgi:small subunit ribosomal protein S10